MGTPPSFNLLKEYFLAAGEFLCVFHVEHIAGKRQGTGKAPVDRGFYLYFLSKISCGVSLEHFDRCKRPYCRVINYEK
jgi:hypothetical protein